MGFVRCMGMSEDDLQANRTPATYTSNGTDIVINPDSPYVGMKKATINIAVPSKVRPLTGQTISATNFDINLATGGYDGASRYQGSIDANALTTTLAITEAQINQGSSGTTPPTGYLGFRSVSWPAVSSIQPLTDNNVYALKLSDQRSMGSNSDASFSYTCPTLREITQGLTTKTYKVSFALITYDIYETGQNVSYQNATKNDNSGASITITMSGTSNTYRYRQDTIAKHVSNFTSDETIDGPLPPRTVSLSVGDSITGTITHNIGTSGSEGKTFAGNQVILLKVYEVLGSEVHI